MKTRPIKSERHLALVQDTEPMVDPFGPWKLPGAARERVCCDGLCMQGRSCPRNRRPTLRRRIPWPVRWPFTVALVAAAMLWAVTR